MNYEEVIEAVKETSCKAEAIRYLGKVPYNGNYRSITKVIRDHQIDTSHWLSVSELNSLRNESKGPPNKIPTEEILVEGSDFNTSRLKQRLYEDGIKEKECEFCHQGEYWKGKRLSLILDHINGTYNDHRVDNLRILCPNCNATLNTHCKGRQEVENSCAFCKTSIPQSKKFCSRSCSNKNQIGKQNLHQRRAERPTIERLLKEIEELGYEGTGKKYNVSGNAIRKWKKSDQPGTLTN